jgi:hypothetical protein
MNYVADVIARIIFVRAATGRRPLDPRLVRLYALLAMTTGVDTTTEHVHDAWAVFANDRENTHPDIIPFARLTPENQRRDDRHRDLIRGVARDLAAVR